MPAGRWGSDDEWWGEEPLDPRFAPDDDLEHEVALAAALDRSRTDLSPDDGTAERMRADFFAALEKEWGAPEESATERTTRIEPVPAHALEQTTDLTAALRPEGLEGATRSASSGERTVAANATAGAGARRSKRGARHVLPADHPDNPGRAGGTRGPGGRRPSLRKRVALVGGAAALALVALAGGTAMMSRDALPGDSLYAVKLATESTGTAFTFGDGAKAQRHLDLAATRLDEVRALQQAGRTPDPGTYEAALTAFDDAASEGSRMMLSGAQPPTDTGLGDLDAWAQKQAKAIEALRSSGGEVPGADRSARLLERMSERAAALQARMGCSEVSDGVDDLGPIPATGTCVPVAANAGQGGGTVDQQIPNGSPQSARTSPAAPSDSTGPQPSTDPSTTENGLLPEGVLPGTGDPGATSTTTSGSERSSSTQQSSSNPPSGGGGGLLPPIQLPPLLPGLGPITIG
ncbi:DUF5667 domain-containing protein [Pseudonocardia kujensis]|uniref:DUF5667 domain-containing protein n=1 Tax=Pseudonocardia kujensis TaxID=1128675 RepID=UPI001E43F9A9|nr:DUF5667 domain-containing protein [Pseudonocardia kujensis]MCE0768406.1 DUF5667 domain-containing protein [Pseudonocardia kujensis]